MSRLLRPYIPLAIRVQIAERQCCGRFPEGRPRDVPLGVWLEFLLAYLFDRQPAHLDHNPALENRPFNSVTRKYIPDANDPDYLIYRTKQDHRIKTLVHGDGAQLSDAAIARKRKRAARKRNPKRRVAKIPARVNPWPKGRKLRSRK